MSGAHGDLDRIYLDHNARSPLRPEARSAMVAALSEDGNASSVHREGRAARRLVEDAREAVAALVGARPAEVVFTSGATEANNLAMAGGWDTVYRAGIEHESVLAPGEALGKMAGVNVVALSVDPDGAVESGGLGDVFGQRPARDVRVLLTLQMANNETGVCQDVMAAVAVAREYGICTHTDAVQAPGRILLDFAALGVDLMSVSSHKIGGPMGVGALVVRDGFQLPAMIRGGGQERQRRAGTENVAAIAGFGAAADAAAAGLAREGPRLSLLRDQVEAGMLDDVAGAVVIGGGARRLPNTVCIALPGALAETTVIKLDLAGIAVSAGSACSSGKVGMSHVLGAMGVRPEIARSAIRISLGWNTTETSLEEFLTRFRRLIATDARAVA